MLIIVVPFLDSPGIKSSINSIEGLEMKIFLAITQGRRRVTGAVWT